MLPNFHLPGKRGSPCNGFYPPLPEKLAFFWASDLSLSGWVMVCGSKSHHRFPSLQDTRKSLRSVISFDFQQCFSLPRNGEPTAVLWGFDPRFNPSFEPGFPQTEGCFGPVTLHDGDWTQPDSSGICSKEGIHEGGEIPKEGILRGAEIPMPISRSLAPQGRGAFAAVFQQHV